MSQNPVTKLKLPKKGFAGRREAQKIDDKVKPTTLVTAEDYLEEGSELEENGDRWYGSDLSKALRFYQKAFEHYQQAIELGNDAEAYYNCTRLLFHVYSSYTKPGYLDMIKTDGISSVLVGLEDIVKAYQQAASLPNPSTDLLYNMALVYTEVVEADDDPQNVWDAGVQAQKLLMQVLGRQLNEFDQFLSELSEISTGGNAGVTGSGNTNSSSLQTTEMESVSVVQPTDIFDTVLAGFKLVQAMAELGVTLDNEWAQFVSQLDAAANNLVNNFSETSSSPNSMVQNLTQSQVEELSLSKLAIEAVSGDSAHCIELWNNDSRAPVTAERYMVANDCLNTVIEREGIADPQLQWKVISQQAAWLKQAQTLLSERHLTINKTLLLAEELGLLLAQLAECIIARADAEIQRSQINCDAANNNREVLVRNAKTLLKSAMLYAKTSGGLRERALEKLARQAQLAEAVARMGMLEGKLALEMDQIMGVGKWQKVVQEILVLGIYPSIR